MSEAGEVGASRQGMKPEQQAKATSGLPKLGVLAAGELGFGAAGLGNLQGVMEDSFAYDLCEEAWQNGFRYFDTAPHYGIGLSEQRLGEFLRTKPREEFVISTKVGRVLEPVDNPSGALDLENYFHVPANFTRRLDYTADGIRRSLDDSRERMGIDHIDIAFVHDPEFAPQGLRAGLEDSLAALADLKAQGQISAIGVGSMSTETLAAAVEVGPLDLLMVAGRYTLLEQPALGVLDAAAEIGAGVVVASVFNSGLLAQPRLDPDATYEYERVSPEVFDRARAIADVCERYGVELPSAALAFPMLHPATAAVITGINATGQASQNAARASAEIPPALWEDLREAGLIPG